MLKNWHLYHNVNHTILWMWTTTRQEYVGAFYSYNDACGFALNCLGHKSSHTFTVTTEH